MGSVVQHGPERHVQARVFLLAEGYCCAVLCFEGREDDPILMKEAKPTMLAQSLSRDNCERSFQGIKTLSMRDVA